MVQNVDVDILPFLGAFQIIASTDQNQSHPYSL